MQNNVEDKLSSNRQEQQRNEVIDDSLETLPMRSARRIIQYIREKLENNSEISPPKKRAIESIITEERILKEIEQMVGKEYFDLGEEVLNLGKKININQKMDIDYSDRPEPIVLTNQVKKLYGGEIVNDKSKMVAISRRFDKSKYSHASKLKQQQELNKKLINNAKKLKVDPRDIEENEPIRLVYDEEKPTQKDIEIYRGDKNEELTDEERALQQAVNYMQKYKEYFKYIQDIKYLRHIPSKSSRSMIIENFEKYLMDAKYYVHFYRKYSYFWAPESTRSVESYKGLYVPIEKRKEEDTFDFKSLDSYEPLRTMIFQDFHDRVRKGLPPSLDLDGKLPLLAMHYARTTFVPPMTKEEMNNLFYPISDNTRNHQIPKYEGHKQESIENPAILNRFQKYYFSRSHLHNLKTLFWYYDPYSEGLKSVTVEEFLDNISRLIYFFEKELHLPKEDQCLGLFHSCTYHSTISKELIMILSACFFMGLPFVTSFGKFENFQDVLSSISKYCSLPVVASSDHRIISKMLDHNHSSASKLLYYGGNESSVHQEKSLSFAKDPISNILKPIKKLHVNSDRYQINHWEYIPTQLDTNTLLFNYKESVKTKTSELDSADIENIRQSVVTKYLRGEKKQDILYMSHNGSDLDCVTKSVFEKVIDSLNEQLKELLDHMKTDKSVDKHEKANIVVISNGFSMLTPYLIGFFYENALSFCFIPINEKETLMKQLADIEPDIIISDAHTINLVSDILNSRSTIHNKKDVKTTVVNTDKLNNMNIEYEGLITDWTMSNTLRNVKNSFSLLGRQAIHQWTPQAIIATGPSLPCDTIQNLTRVKFVYQIIQEDKTMSPLFVRDLRRKEHSLPKEVVKPWEFVAINEKNQIVIEGVTTTVNKRGSFGIQKEELVLANMENIVFDTNTTKVSLEDSMHLRNNLIEKYKQVEMPKDVRESLTKCFKLKEELDFYSQVKKMVQKRESSTSKPTTLAFFDNILYSVLLEELESITSINNIEDIGEILKYLELRIDLTAQCVQLQLTDFRFRFSSALKEKKIKFHFKQPPTGISITVSHNTFTTNSFYIQNDFCFRVLISNNSNYNLDLIESIFESKLKHRIIITKYDNQIYTVLFTRKSFLDGGMLSKKLPQILDSLRIHGLLDKEKSKLFFGVSFTNQKLVDELKNSRYVHCHGLDCFDGDNRMMLRNDEIIHQFIEQTFHRERYSKL